jgi:spore coat protein H
VVLLWRIPAVQGWVMLQILRHQVGQPAEVPPSPALTSQEAAWLTTNASSLHLAAALFEPTNVWDVQLKFTSNQWTALGPNTVPPIPGFIRPDGSVILRNPKASRNGLAGVLGIDFPWSNAALDFDDVKFATVAVRFKGNGTFIDSQRTYKRPFKVDLAKDEKSRQLAGRTTLNFHNLTADASCLSDTLAYEFFRNAGVPASRTAFARLRLTIEGRFEDRLLGLYILVENPDAQWAREQFGVAGVALFKPVTYELFEDLGDDWERYQDIYDPKTKTRPKQRRRLIDLAKLLTHASDRQFSQQVGDFIDLDEFARYLACEVLLSNYDGILSNGQNFLLYLDPRTERFGFIPWDLDHSWGEFPFIGTREQREHASVWHPWVGENRFLEKMLATELFRQRYRRELERLRETAFVPEHLGARVAELATVVRPFIAEESTRRLKRFEDDIFEGREGVEEGGTGKSTHGFSHKRFFAARAQSVSDQLAGRSEGVILSRRPTR